MPELLEKSTHDQSSDRPAATALYPSSDQSKYADRCIHLLADRRRRFCLYYLYFGPTPLSVRDLAALVEASLIPAEASVNERIREEAEHRLRATHLPKLQDAGLVQICDSHVEIPSNPAFPIREWLALTAKVELER